jgi:hypothetical protein
MKTYVYTKWLVSVVATVSIITAWVFAVSSLTKVSNNDPLTAEMWNKIIVHIDNLDEAVWIKYKNDGVTLDISTIWTQDDPWLSCKDILEQNSLLQNGDYFIKPTWSLNTIWVYCDMINWGWTRVMRMKWTTSDWQNSDEYWINKDQSYKILDVDINNLVSNSTIWYRIWYTDLSGEIQDKLYIKNNCVYNHNGVVAGSSNCALACLDSDFNSCLSTTNWYGTYSWIFTYIWAYNLVTNTTWSTWQWYYTHNTDHCDWSSDDCSMFVDIK